MRYFDRQTARVCAPRRAATAVQTTGIALAGAVLFAASMTPAFANDARSVAFMPILAPATNVEPLAFPQKWDPSTGLPTPLQISASAGPAKLPSFEQPVMHQFDAVAACAGADVEIEGMMLPPEKLASAPELPLLERFWQTRGADKKAIALGAEVPPLFLARVPQDLTSDVDVARKKRAFILMMLPHILAVNEEILAERARIKNIQSRLDAPIGPSPYEIDWLFTTLEKYGVDGFDLNTLLARADVIPPSLAIAQAAKESGWGGSRFARTGNAMYGQWTWDPDHKGIVPRQRSAGKTHRVRAFDSLIAATRAYAVNINTHGAYGRLREIRRDRRAQGRQATGRELSVGLGKYSEIGQRYVRAVQSIIRRNGLANLDGAKLAPSLSAPPLPDALEGVTGDKFTGAS